MNRQIKRTHVDPCQLLHCSKQRNTLDVRHSYECVTNTGQMRLYCRFLTNLANSSLRGHLDVIFSHFSLLFKQWVTTIENRIMLDGFYSFCDVSPIDTFKTVNISFDEPSIRSCHAFQTSVKHTILFRPFQPKLLCGLMRAFPRRQINSK